jgi:hypothetical protein
MSFPWLERTHWPKHGGERRTRVAADELASRAGLLYRLGFTEAAATKRLCARVAWEYDPPSKHGPHRRPDALSDQAIAKIVSETFSRRPG